MANADKNDDPDHVKDCNANNFDSSALPNDGIGMHAELEPTDCDALTLKQRLQTSVQLDSTRQSPPLAASDHPLPDSVEAHESMSVSSSELMEMCTSTALASEPSTSQQSMLSTPSAHSSFLSFANLQSNPCVSRSNAAQLVEPFICGGCRKRITDRYLLQAIDQYWHEDCLQCSACHCRLGEVGSKLYYKYSQLLCQRDYLRLFGNKGECAACHNAINGFDYVMRARSNVYHLQCFKCQECMHNFCVGDKFYLCDGKVLCEYDYEERMMFANMAAQYNGCTSQMAAQIKKQLHGLDVGEPLGALGHADPAQSIPLSITPTVIR